MMRIVLSFLTHLPVGTFVSDDYFRSLGRRAPLFPLAGLVVGLLSSAAGWLVALGFPGPVSAAAAIVAGVVITGGLHLDGLMDTADGVTSHRSRERMLEIMRDSRIGAMAAIALALIILVRFSLLTATPPPIVWQAIIVAPVLGRAAMAVSAGLAPAARSGVDERQRGLGAGFAEHVTRGGMIAASVVGVGTAALIGGWRGIAAAAAAGMAAGITARKLVLTLGGLTGDTLGAINELTEVVAIAAFAFVPGGVR